MNVATTINEVRNIVMEWKKQGLSVGLVPTMGYLHEGHGSLVKESVKRCDKTIASVFVNPTQFAPNEDFEDYPRDFERDCKLLEGWGCDLVFHPETAEMYPEGFCTYIENQSDMPKTLCGKTRPIHFRGVCTVVGKLFNIALPDMAFFGQKDAQQLAIIKRMAKDLSFGVQVIGCPIIREEDGLAKSSRNIYLSPEERKAALVLSKAVFKAKELFDARERDTARIISEMTKLVEAEPLAKTDYISAVDAETLEDVSEIKKETLVAMAVYIGKTRLIDNVTLIP